MSDQDKQETDTSSEHVVKVLSEETALTISKSFAVISGLDVPSDVLQDIANALTNLIEVDPENQKLYRACASIVLKNKLFQMIGI